MKIAQGIRACGGIYIPNFGKISVKISVLGILYPYRCTDRGEIWHGGVDRRCTPPCQISPPSVQRVTRGVKNLKIGLYTVLYMENVQQHHISILNIISMKLCLKQSNYCILTVSTSSAIVMPNSTSGRNSLWQWPSLE